MTSLGTTAPAEERAATTPCREASSGERLRLLLAEDNVVNQRLAVSLLTRRGHCVVVAANGREALEALYEQTFDAVLMDVQMPEMDGFEATAAIRAREATSGLHTPIIAMTAHALKGDRERCREAGMDAYVSKPLRPQELFGVLESVVCPSGNQTETSTITDGQPAVFDMAAALKRVDGDTGLLKELATLFLAECPQLMANIRQAIDERDAPKLHRSAHALKGSVGNFGSSAAFDAAQRLENAGRTRNWSRAEHDWQALEVAIGRFEPTFLELVD